MVRTDLAVGLQFAQACHASCGAGKLFNVPDNAFLIVCALPGEAELTRLAQELVALGLNCFVFHEPDLNGEATALASLVPHAARKFFNRLPLWRHP